MNHTGTPWRTRAREQLDTLLDGALDAVLDTLETDWSAQSEATSRNAAELARNLIAETLNQGLRRIRAAKTPEDAGVLAVESTTPFASRCAVFLFRDDQACALASRGLGPLPLSFSPDDGAAFRTCIDTQDPVIAVSSESEISKEMAERVGSDSSDRVFLLPLVVRGEVKSILFATGLVQPAAMELIAGITAIQMEALAALPVPQRTDLVAIAGAPSTPESSLVAKQAKARRTWTDLSPDLQALHLRAQREARLRVAEMRLEHASALRKGVETSDIYSAVREPIDAARAKFRQDYVAASPTMVDYLYLELVRSLAQENDRLLGPQFPGPLV